MEKGERKGEGEEKRRKGREGRGGEERGKEGKEGGEERGKEGRGEERGKEGKEKNGREGMRKQSLGRSKMSFRRSPSNRSSGLPPPRGKINSTPTGAGRNKLGDKAGREVSGSE